MKLTKADIALLRREVREHLIRWDRTISEYEGKPRADAMVARLNRRREKYRRVDAKLAVLFRDAGTTARTSVLQASRLVR